MLRSTYANVNEVTTPQAIVAEARHRIDSAWEASTSGVLYAYAENPIKALWDTAAEFGATVDETIEAEDLFLVQ